MVFCKDSSQAAVDQMNTKVSDRHTAVQARVSCVSSSKNHHHHYHTEVAAQASKRLSLVATLPSDEICSQASTSSLATPTAVPSARSSPGTTPQHPGLMGQCGTPWVTLSLGASVEPTKPDTTSQKLRETKSWGSSSLADHLS